MWCYLFDELHLCLVSPGVWSFSTPTSPSPPWCLCTPPSSLTNHTLCHITHWPIRGPLSACPSCHSQRLGIRLETSLFSFFFWLAACLIRLQFVLDSPFVCLVCNLLLSFVHVWWVSPQHSPHLGCFRAANHPSTDIFFFHLPNLFFCYTKCLTNQNLVLLHQYVGGHACSWRQTAGCVCSWWQADSALVLVSQIDFAIQKHYFRPLAKLRNSFVAPFTSSTADSSLQSLSFTKLWGRVKLGDKTSAGSEKD